MLVSLLVTELEAKVVQRHLNLKQMFSGKTLKMLTEHTAIAVYLGGVEQIYHPNPSVLKGSSDFLHIYFAFYTLGKRQLKLSE